MSELPLKTLVLDGMHRALGGKMCPFAGYEMPVQYEAGVLKEHLHTRAAAGLFDVSHMGQVLLRPKSSMEDLARAFEKLMPVDVLGLAEGRQRYGLLTTPEGGILDDLMFAHRGDHFYVVVNAAGKEEDLAHLRAHLSEAAEIEAVADRALLALQGPQSESVLQSLGIDASPMRFMDVANFTWQDITLWISRSGYTGEDGFEISLPEVKAEAFARALLSDPRVLPIGLGARDSLRLEAGLCLYGHDLTVETTPVAASLTWALGKARKLGGSREGGFIGAEKILSELAQGAAMQRVGLRPEGRAPMREGTRLFAGDEQIGEITSGGFGPSLNAPIAMGYLRREHAALGTQIEAELRGKRLPVTVASLPFHPSAYKR